MNWVFKVLLANNFTGKGLLDVEMEMISGDKLVTSWWEFDCL